VEGLGQLDDTVKLYVNTFAGTVFVTSDGLTYSIIDQNEDESTIVEPPLSVPLPPRNVDANNGSIIKS